VRQSDNIFDAINDSVCIISPEGRIIRCNRSTEKLLNKSADELIGHFCYEVMHGIQEPLPDCPLLRMKETNCRESAVIESDGRWLEVMVDPILDDTQRIVAAIHIIADITEHKKAEEALRKNEDRLQSIFSAAPVGIGVVSKRVIMEANDRLCAMTGYNREELVGQSARILYLDEKDFNFVGSEKYRQITETGTGTVETRWRMKNGKMIHVLLSSTPFDLNKMARGVTFTALDITERKQAEEALFNEKEKLLILSEHAPFGMSLVAKNGQFLYVNPKHKDIFGYEISDTPDMETWFRKAYPDAAYRHNVRSAWLDDTDNARHGERRAKVFNVTCKDG